MHISLALEKPFSRKESERRHSLQNKAGEFILYITHLFRSRKAILWRAKCWVEWHFVLRCVTVCWSMNCSILPSIAVRCSVLQCVVVCCSVLQCVAVCCSVLFARRTRIYMCTITHWYITTITRWCPCASGVRERKFGGPYFFYNVVKKRAQVGFVTSGCTPVSFYSSWQ